MLGKRIAHVTTRRSQLFIKCANGEIELWIILVGACCQRHSVRGAMCSCASIGIWMSDVGAHGTASTVTSPEALGRCVAWLPRLSASSVPTHFLHSEN